MKKILTDATGRVCEIKNPGEEFPVHAGLTWRDGPDTVTHEHFWDGVQFVAPTPPPLADSKAAALKQIDAAAEAARGRFITPGSGQALVYERKRAESAAFAAVVAAGGAPVVADYPLMNARAVRLATTLQAVADDWNARSAAWVAVAAQIENTREAAKEQVAAATAAPAIDAIVAALSWPVP
jgi:hypothetical protein